MPSFRTQRIVAHAPAAMFDLVADLERYPDFLPLCEALTIKSRSKAADGREVVVARMTAGFGLIHESFTSRATFDRANLKVFAEYIDGPFHHMHNTWTFRESPGRDRAGGCEVDFLIDYEFKSLALQLLMGAMFDRAFRKFAAAFEARADAIYGRPGAGAALTA